MYPTNFTRKQFLQLSSLTLCAGALAGCGLFKRGEAETPENYYRLHAEKFIQETQPFADAIRFVAVEKYGQAQARAWVDQAMQDFRALLLGLPYIGGSANDLTMNLYQSAYALALYRVMQASGMTAKNTGELLYFGFRRAVAGEPLAGVSGRLSFSALAQSKLKADAETSQKRLYPDDFVFEIVPGDERFDFGIDYTECGICKYFHAQGADELKAYLCVLDFPMSEVLNTGLMRTTTIARGDARCDFRYKYGGPVQIDWAPEFLKNE